MRVTFDTNALDPAVRPERFRRGPRYAEYVRINQALSFGLIKGFFSETIVTYEGIQNKDRAATFGSATVMSHRRVGDCDHRIKLSLKVEMPARKALHSEVAARLEAALKVGMRALSAPRIGNTRIEDPTGIIYFKEVANSAAQKRRLDNYSAAARAIESKGLGFAQVTNLAKQFALRAGVEEPWYKSLARATNIHEEKAVNRAIAEWADCDSVAAHIGYGIDFFCTEDKGMSAGAPSIFSKDNSVWLKEELGVRLVSLSDLANML